MNHIAIAVSHSLSMPRFCQMDPAICPRHRAMRVESSSVCLTRSTIRMDTTMVAIDRSCSMSAIMPVGVKFMATEIYADAAIVVQ